MILEEYKRVDGREIYDIRPLSCNVGIIPRVHGSGLFNRGRTQVLSLKADQTFPHNEKRQNGL